MPRDAVSRTANVERNGGHKWVKNVQYALGWESNWKYFSELVYKFGGLEKDMRNLDIYWNTWDVLVERSKS